MKKETFFSSKLSFSNVITIFFLYFKQNWKKSGYGMTGHSSDTITNWISYCTQVIVEDLVLTRTTGEDIIVEIDESKFGKRKFNSGHRVEGSCPTLSNPIFREG